VSYIDNTLADPGSTDNVYCYRLLAFNAAGNSAYSNEVCKTIAALPLGIPAAPSNLTIK
jgi:hypothetical protein